MSLTLYFHPLASFCWKPLIAFYENNTRFAPQIVDLGDAQSRAAFLKVSPTGKMPALR
ncbi:MAG: glutathione S-transferase family protein, partial [Mesorhizobium sp.]